MSEPEQQAALARIRTARAVDAIKGAEIVIEAATENFEVKRHILKQLDALVAPQTIVASNTSSISITKLAATIWHPDRFIGMHFLFAAKKVDLCRR